MPLQLDNKIIHWFFGNFMIAPETTIEWVWWPMAKGSTHSVATYPLDQLNTAVQVSNVRHVRDLTPNSEIWKLVFDVTNASANSVLYQIWVLESIPSIQ